MLLQRGVQVWIRKKSIKRTWLCDCVFVLSTTICSETQYVSSVTTSTWPSNQYWVELGKDLVRHTKFCHNKKTFFRNLFFRATTRVS